MRGKTLSFLMVVLVLIGASTLNAEEPQRSKESPRPDFWEPASADVAALAGQVVKAGESRKELSQRLQKIALDESRKGADRHAAIFSLGKLGDEQSLDFLAQHIALHVPPDFGGTKVQQMRSWPCSIALSSGGWNSIPAILRSLEQERSDLELIWSGLLLARDTPGKEFALALLNVELRRAKSEAHRQNLQRVLEIVASDS